VNDQNQCTDLSTNISSNSDELSDSRRCQLAPDHGIDCRFDGISGIAQSSVGSQSRQFDQSIVDIQSSESNL